MSNPPTTDVDEKQVQCIRKQIAGAEGECEHIYECVLPLLESSPKVSRRLIDSDTLRIPCETIVESSEYDDMEKAMFLFGLIEGLSRLGTHIEPVLEGDIDLDEATFDSQYENRVNAFISNGDEAAPFNNEEHGVW